MYSLPNQPVLIRVLPSFIRFPQNILIHKATPSHTTCVYTHKYTHINTHTHTHTHTQRYTHINTNTGPDSVATIAGGKA